MLTFVLLASTSMMVPSSSAPMQRPPVEVLVITRDRILIRSSSPIRDAYLAPNNRYTCFVDESSPDRRQAIVIFRTTRNPLRLVVETGTIGSAFHKKHSLTIRNPTLRR